MNPDQELLHQRYLADHITTASPAQRLLMLFDGLLSDLDRAEEGFSLGDLKLVNDHLVHAQQILFALRDPLETQSRLGASLAAVYTFCLDQLLTANLRKEAAPIAVVRPFLTRIAEANRAAVLRASEPAAASA